MRTHLHTLFLALLLSCTPDAQPAPKPPCTKWEYRVQQAFPAQPTKRDGTEALSSTSVTPSQADMNETGLAGWELVSVVSEVETAYPQINKTVLMNVRQQRLLLFWKKSACD